MKHIVKNKHWNIPEDYNINKILYLLIDRPNRINNCNNFVWENKKFFYYRKYDLPAIICINGYVCWYKNNLLHRENKKPAVICEDGIKQYHKGGFLYKTEEPI